MLTYIQMLSVVVMWSIVGPLVKCASASYGSGVITLSRFIFGAIFLAILLLVRDGRVRFDWKNKWILVGVAGKCLNYLTENIALTRGYSYGNVIILPMMAVILAVISVIWFKEKLSPLKVSAIMFCITGVSMLTWKSSPSEPSSFGLVNMLLFSISAIGAAIHIFSQKVLVADMDSGVMNFTVFSASSVVCLVLLPLEPQPVIAHGLFAFSSLIGLGFITGISFFLYVNALKSVPLIAATLMSNSSALMTLLWSRLLFDEPMTALTGIGTVVFIVGIVLVNIPDRRPKSTHIDAHEGSTAH